MAARADGRRIGVGHRPAFVEDGVTGRTAELVDGHGQPPASSLGDIYPDDVFKNQ
jgi:hypothetical protein